MSRSAFFALALTATLAFPLAAFADDHAAHLAIGDPARKDRTVGIVLDGITDSATGDTISVAELAARLDGVRLLFVGESHVDMEFHRVQLRVLQELQRRGRTVMIGLEMYPVTEQQWLDRWYGNRKLTEEQFLTESRWYKNWGYHWNYYRDIFLFAREHRVRMFGVNLPRGAVSTIRAKGFDSLTVAQRAMLPPRIDLENEEHKRLFRAFFGDEDALHGNMPEGMFNGMFRAQCGWDAAMGWNAVQALKKYGDEKSIMVVLIGSGHVAYGLGAERQVKPFFDGRIASVIPYAVADEPGGKPTTHVQASYANFTWGLPASTDPIYPSTGISTAEAKSGPRYKVINVAEDSPAAAAGVKTGDEIISIDGVLVDEKETSNRYMSTKRWGDDLRYRLMRGGQEIELTVHLRRKHSQPEPDSSAAAPQAPQAPKAPAAPSGGNK
ncbi:MAG: ChaN family lipoprotein [Candidatus Eisenbacteria bacterium]|uniref:ChaN family lipoprotein n=1 Tax=Eiseniibacteriota bacterium TaxID=2212470 RepID=A0A933W1J6_UNCEI|nr:ChaN family lipoprotein [Candidatus Eisenbacteria bacterium]